MIQSAVLFDKEGFLRKLSDWSPQVAEEISKQESIVLSAAHWEVINLQRNYYDTYKIAPVTRVLIKLVKESLGADKGNSIYLMTLFTGKPAKISAKIAGLPKPTNCD
ncbi:MAG: tRNA 2-thiouridine synthesizing protein E [Candidatus Azotimanducaceae bacterium]|jgi:tRNA 2-thiouridine synthesizing protein E